MELAVKEPEALLSKVRHAGAIFLGPHSCEVLGDYCAGPNHVLPTGGTARFFSTLSFDDYVKKSNIVSYSKEELWSVKDHVVRLALMEGLDAHGKSMESRWI